MWAVGICERCGTVTSFRTTNPVVKNLVRGKTYYCPVCGLYRLLHIRAIPNTSMLDSAYNDLRVGVLLAGRSDGEKYVAAEETTEQLVSKTKKDPNEPRYPWESD